MHARENHYAAGPAKGEGRGKGGTATKAGGKKEEKTYANIMSQVRAAAFEYLKSVHLRK